jgi:hypothetical protein
VQVPVPDSQDVADDRVAGARLDVVVDHVRLRQKIKNYLKK